MKKLLLIALLVFAPVNSFGCDDLDQWSWVVVTPKGDFHVRKVVYWPDSHEWFVDMAEKIDGPYFQTVLPCNWVKLYNADGEVTEEMAKKW